MIYEGQLKALLTSRYVPLITMQNMLVPPPEVMLRRLSVRELHIACCTHHTVFRSLVIYIAQNK
jgi:hypothetical protein